MQKLKYLALIFLVISSALYDYQKSDGSVESAGSSMEITVTVEGDVSETLTFDHVPKVDDLFTCLGIENNYGLDEGMELQNNQLLYLNSDPDLISLSEASFEKLQTLKGIGAVTAKKIIDYRNTAGFETIEDIMKIKGIGEKTYLKLRERLCI